MFTGIEVPEPSLPPTCQVLYAVVDKTKKKSPGKCNNFQKENKDKLLRTKKSKFSLLLYLAMKDESYTICMSVLEYVVNELFTLIRLFLLLIQSLIFFLSIFLSLNNCVSASDEKVKKNKKQKRQSLFFYLFNFHCIGQMSIIQSLCKLSSY